jgi:hypothetical protein
MTALTFLIIVVTVSVSLAAIMSGAWLDALGANMSFVQTMTGFCAEHDQHGHIGNDIGHRSVSPAIWQRRIGYARRELPDHRGRKNCAQQRPWELHFFGADRATDCDHEGY